MVDEIKVYISAAPDLEHERDLLGRLIAEIPVTLGWRIVQTPSKGEPVDLKAISAADIHLLIIGRDIRAPVGYEWLAARRASRSPWLFLKQGILHTSAAHDFIQRVGDPNDWIRFNNGAELRKLVEQLIAEHILARADLYEVRGKELETLVAWKKGLDKKQESEPDRLRRGAGDSGVIISPERYVPRDGVLLTPREEAEED